MFVIEKQTSEGTKSEANSEGQRKGKVNTEGTTGETESKKEEEVNDDVGEYVKINHY
jgi:hypothetical protein